MSSEERLNKILSIVETQRFATDQELAELLGVSESTIRRALTALAAAGKVSKVFGGAIARYAASLIRDDAFVYLYVGTTIVLIIDFIHAEGVPPRRFAS